MTGAQRQELLNWKQELEEKKNAANRDLEWYRDETERLRFRMAVTEGMPESQHKSAAKIAATRDFMEAREKLEQNELRLLNDINQYDALLAEIDRLLS
jgi:hypothetical protein